MSPIEQMQAMMRWAQVDDRPTATKELTCFIFFLSAHCFSSLACLCCQAWCFLSLSFFTLPLLALGF